MGTCPGLAYPESAGLDFGQVWTRTDPSLQSKPGPLGGYPDPLLPTSIEDHLQCEVSQIANDDMFICGRYHDLEQ